MVSFRKWMKNEYKLRKNPFPEVGIVNPDQSEARDNGQIFQSDIVGPELEQFASKFIVTPLETGANFGFLWSLGVGEGARGFGKTATMINMANIINSDFGKNLLTEQGDYGNDEAEELSILASFGTFDKNTVTNFNAVAFEQVKWLAKFEKDDQEPLISQIRDRCIDELGLEDEENPDEITEEIVSAVKKRRRKVKGKTLGKLKEDFLYCLASGDIDEVEEAIEEVTSWHRERNGFLYLDAMLSLLIIAGVKKLFLFIDQVEDFADTTVTKQKRRREVERFRDVVRETFPFAEYVSFVLTLHPNAANSIIEMWELADLPSYDYNAPENRGRIVILKEIKDVKDAQKLIESYLNYPGYRIKPVEDSVFPFTENAIIEMWNKISIHKPRNILKYSQAILHVAAQKNIKLIDSTFINGFALDEYLEKDEFRPSKFEQKPNGKLPSHLE